MRIKRNTVVILGSGYLARFMLFLTDFYQNVLHTSRDPEHHLTWLPPKQRLRFDLNETDTWSHIPSEADLLWCFPALPVPAVQQFASQINGSRPLVVLGSTSAYDAGIAHDTPSPWIDETAPLDLEKPRVQGEEFLRAECGAIVLRVAGIYGPGRHPYEWIKNGRVGLSDKYVNLIHVEDLAAICLATLEHGVSGTVYNVSDGMPRTWREIGRGLGGGQLPEPETAEQKHPRGKRINTTKLRALLQKARISLRHPDLFRALEDLQHARAGTQAQRIEQ